MNVKEFIKSLRNDFSKDIVRNICEKYDINLESDLDCSHDIISGAYLNHAWLSIGDIFNSIEEIDNEY